MQTKNATVFRRTLCGVAVGAANGLFGGGGGMLAVPLLTKTGYEEKTAHATANLSFCPFRSFPFSFIFGRDFTIFPCSSPPRLA